MLPWTCHYRLRSPRRMPPWPWHRVCGASEGFLRQRPASGYVSARSNLKGKMDSTHNGVVNLAHTFPKHNKVVVDGLTIDKSGNIVPFAPHLHVPFKFGKPRVSCHTSQYIDGQRQTLNHQVSVQYAFLYNR